MGYFEHARLNLIVAYKSALSCGFHLAHALLPFEFTSHEWWGIKLTKGDHDGRTS